MRRVAALATACAAASMACQIPTPRLSYRTLALPEARHVLEYSVYTPPGFEPKKGLPLVVFAGRHNWQAWTPTLDRVLAIQRGDTRGP